MAQEEKMLPKINHKKIIKRYEFRLNLKNILFYLLIIFLGISFFLSLTKTQAPPEEIPLTQVLTDAKEGKIQRIEVEDAKLTIKYKDGKDFISRKEEGASLFETFKAAGLDPEKVETEIKDTAGGRIWLSLLGNFLPLLLMILFFLFLFRQARGAQESIFSFGQSRAKLFSKDMSRVTFADVAGVDEAKQELSEVVDFLKNPGKYRALGARTPKGALLLGPPGVGKCVTGDTIIWVNKGLMEIREIPRYYYVDSKSHQVYGAGLASFDTDKVLSADKFASHWFDLGKQATIKIELAQGFSLEGTSEHPVIMMGADGKLRFRRLDQIQKDDYVAIQYGREMFGHLEMIDEETAYLLGILTGDGNLSHSSRVGFTSIDPELIDFFKGYIQARYAKNAITVRDQSYLVSSWDLKRYLYQMGMSYLLSFDKVVPSTVLQAPKQIQIAFLQGLFDTDAAVEKGRATIEYTTVSEKMARQVQMMLLNLGVVASLNIKGKTENGYHRPVYRLTITGSSLRAFGNLVGFRLTRKKKLLDGHVEKVKRVNTNVDVIPGIAHQLDESWRELSQKGLSNERLAKTVDKIRRRGRVSRQTLVDYVSYASSFKINLPHLEYFRDLLEAKLFFSQVVDKSEGWARVYDFTVPKTHTFLGNGFLNHNTLLARAVAGEAGVPFFSMAGSEFMEMLVGVGSARMRDLFQTAKRSAPAIIFIDEIESIGRARSMGGITSHDEREQTLNQMLVEMDGFTPNDNVVVIAATNRPDLLDPALLRPGRFDRRVILDMPDIEGRKDILKIHMRGKPFTPEVDWEKIAKRTVGFSGADLENMLNEAAILAARLGKRAIDMNDLEESATRVKLGPEKKRLQSDLDKKMTAYHEAGHAIVANQLPHMDPVHRISIVSRGLALGFTLIPPAKDRYTETRSHLLEQITSLLGGRAAEELEFKEFTAGAATDIQKATEIARTMVMEYGMSDLGPINFGSQINASDPVRMWIEPTQLSPDMAAKVDAEVKKIIERAYKEARGILKRLKDKLDLVSGELLKKETLEGEEFEKLMSGEEKEEKFQPKKEAPEEDKLAFAKVKI